MALAERKAVIVFATLALAAATLIISPGVNHVLRPVVSDDRTANLTTDMDATVAIRPTVAVAVTRLVKR